MSDALRAPRDREPRGAALADISDFFVRLYKKLEQDNIFFLSGAIAFNIVVAIVPLILAVLGITGLLLRSKYGENAANQVLRLISEVLPPLNPELLAWFQETLKNLISRATGFVGVGSIFLIWIATRLVGTLRTALREIFDIEVDRGIVLGKLFDMGMVIAAGTLFAVNVGVTVVIELVGNYGRSVLGIDPVSFRAADSLMLTALAFLSIWFMFVLIYRYLPKRRIQWRIAMIAATFTAVLFELMKMLFGWYVTNVAAYNSTYGAFATLIIFLLWIYYMSVAFVIGGEVGQVAALRRIRRRQKERLS